MIYALILILPLVTNPDYRLIVSFHETQQECLEANNQIAFYNKEDIGHSGIKWACYPLGERV